MKTQQQKLHYRSFQSLLFIGLILAATTCFGQGVGANRGEIAGSGGRRSVKGHIYLPDGDVKSLRFKVRLENPDVGVMATATDSDGQFSFNGIAAGTYELTVEPTGNFEAARESIHIDSSSSGPVVMLPIYLRFKPSADPMLAGVPEPAVNSYLKGMESAKKGDSKKAVDLLKQAVTIHPSFGLAFSELGIQYLKLSEPDKAAQALETAVNLNPSRFEPRLYYGIALLNLKKFPEAEEQLNVALRSKNAPLAHMYLGITLMSQQKFAESEKELRTAIASNSSEVALAHRYLGGIYWGKRDYKNAADELEIYLKLMPKAVDAERTRTAIKELRSKK
jgi:Tfp pilus assembly protein PilF